MLVPFTMAGVRFSKYYQKNRSPGFENYVWPSVADMDVTAYAAVFFAIIEIVCRKVFLVFFRPICKE